MNCLNVVVSLDRKEVIGSVKAHRVQYKIQFQDIYAS